MDTHDDNGIPPDLLVKMQRAVDLAAQGIRDPEAMRLACEDMDRLREQIFHREGLLDIGVPAIRALRNGGDEWEVIKHMDADDYTIPPEMMAALQYAADQAAKGIRDPEVMRLACENMDRLRDEIFRKHGVLDIGVPAIRALRNGDDDE
jgi:hypothetical protein